MNRTKEVYFSLFISIIALVSFSFVLAEESISITTYYPSPYGVYNEIRLYPHSTPITSCDSTTEGTIFYNSTAREIQVCNGLGVWKSGGALWAGSGNNIYNTNLGNVGVGTNNPDALFHVYSPTGIGGEIKVESVQAIRGSDTHYAADGREWGVGVCGSNYGNLSNSFFITDQTANGGLGIVRLAINTAGNVGIGINNSSAHLTVYGDAEMKLQSDGNPANYSDIHFDNTLAGGREYVVGNYGPVIGWNPALQNSFFIRDNAGGDRFIIDSNGYVGIGTPSPRAALDVVGDEMIVEDGSPEINFIDSTPGDLNWRIGGGTGGYFSFGPTSEADWETGFGAGSIMILRYMSGVNRTYIGIGMWNPAHVLDLNGGAYCDGTGAWVDASDRAYKKDIDYNFQYGLKAIEQLKPVYYVHKEDETNKKQIGFIAQDVKEIIPEVVEGEEGTYGLAYGRIVPVLVNAIKEQQKKREDLKAQIIEQQKQVEDLKAQVIEAELTESKNSKKSERLR